MRKVGIKRLIVILFLIILSIGMYINVRGSFLQYRELGENYVSILKTNLAYKYGIMLIDFVLTFFIIYISTRGIKKGLKVFFDEEKKEMPKLPNKSISLIISVISSLIAAVIITPKVILYASNVSFEQMDGVFNLDISFYMFTEPLIKMIILYIITIFATLIIYSILYYIIVFNKYFDGVDRETLKRSYLVTHIIRYIRFIAIGFSIYVLVRTFDIVFSRFVTTNNDIQLTGAGITDVIIKLWGNIILSIVIAVSIFLATNSFKESKRNKVLKYLLIIPGYLVIMFITMLGFDLIFVNSNEYDKEKLYIEKNIEYTKEAYGIDCEEDVIEYSGTITEEEVSENSNMIDNISIMSQPIVLENLNETQTEKGYYTYSSIAPLKYDYNGENKLVYISPREIVNNKRTYNSKTFKYTHGYGTILTSATTSTDEGNVEFIKNKKTDDIIKEPQIYYGLETNNTVVVNKNSSEEYDYTDNRGVEYTTTYNGDSGLNLNFIDRLFLGINKGDIQLAFSNKINKQSKILINRNVIDRAKVALSGANLIYDKNPYTVIDDKGELYWVLDAYTISSNYPYSTYTTIQYNGEKKSINYIRNSIKVIVNCYDGDMKFYITDTTDPIAMAYRKMYPDLFEDIERKIPEAISNRFIYPKFLYDIQTKMLEEYHNAKSEVLYRSDDSWKKASYMLNQTTKSTTTLDSYYTYVKDGEDEKIGLIQLYTPNKKQNLASYAIGTIEEGKNKLKIYSLSSDDSILGLIQLDSTIMQNEKIQNEFKELNVTGAKVTKNMVVVPINNTLLYVEGIYQTKTNEANIPLLKRIIVASGNKVAIGNNLDEAIENLISQDATNIDTDSTEDIDGLIQSIIKSNKNLTKSMDANDWELMGTDVKKLQELITLLEKEVTAEEESKNNDTNTNSTDTVTENIFIEEKNVVQ